MQDGERGKAAPDAGETNFRSTSQLGRPILHRTPRGPSQVPLISTAMASFTTDNNECEYTSYTCDDGINQLTRAGRAATLSSQIQGNGEKTAPGRRSETSVPRAIDETLPISYQLMILINEAKFK